MLFNNPSVAINQAPKTVMRKQSMAHSQENFMCGWFWVTGSNKGSC